VDAYMEERSNIMKNACCMTGCCAPYRERERRERRESGGLVDNSELVFDLFDNMCD